MQKSAAVMVLDHYPSDDEVEELTYLHLDNFPTDYATATIEIVKKAPTFLSTCEQDQINAHVRDGGRAMHVLIVYMQESEPFDDDEYEIGFTPDEDEE